MDIMGFLVDLTTSGAMPVQCKLRVEEFNLIITFTELNMELVVPMDAIHMISTDNLHG